MPFPKKLKIVYDRLGCIGAAACASIDPINFVMNTSDGKADLTKSEMQENKSVKILEVANQEELTRVVESAKACPVNIIEIVDLETNQKLAPV